MKALALAFTLAGVLTPAAYAAPELNVPGPMTVEATGPQTRVEYVASASKLVGPENDRRRQYFTITCEPGGTSDEVLEASVLLGIGIHTVTCTGGDPEEQVTGTFTITVRDSTPPAISGMPSSRTVEATSADGAVVTYSLPRASDIVDGPRPTTCSPASGSTFSLGGHVVTCTASDTRGNVARATFSVTVSDTTAPTLVVPPPLDLGVAPTASGVPASDARVEAFFAAARATDDVDPSPTIETDAPLVFPVGTTTVRFTAVDRFGNRSVGTSPVTVAAPPGSPPPPRSPLLAPLNGARVSAPPLLRWRTTRGATYYNVQLWRAGRKILSRWPTRPRLALTATWRYAGRSYRLSPGRYRWYVWPGLGRRTAARYGPLIGQATFVVVRPR